MSFVSTGNKSAGNGGPVITTPPITGESGDMSTGSVATGVADAAEQMAEQAAAELFGALPEPSGLVKAAVTAAQAAAAAAGISDIVSAAQDKRHISGLVTAARVVGHEGRSVTYELRMEPWVKLLTHTSDYKAFQNKTVVDIRMEAQRSPGSRVHGAGNIRTLMTGYSFTLTNHPTAEVNQEYLLVQTTLFVRDNAQHSGQEQHFTYVSTFELHPTREVYRPQRTIDKPHTKGPQSAIVTGPSGQEIWTDQYGRVKVQFGWDRYGKMDENSSCWIRVSYPWAGKGFGMIQIPRIGQEVLVDFKNGDPDLPIIVGRTYNQDTMPPWGLPGMASQSGIFSHSLYGGPTNGNMLRFDDKTGAEEVKFHAEKDLNTTVKNNETHTVNADRTKTIIHNEITKVHIDRTEDVFGKHTETIKGNRNVKVTKGDQLLTVEKGIREVTVKTGTSTETVEKDISITSISGAIHLTAKTQITLTVGKSSLTMNSDGTITLNGPTHLALNPQ
ncbi:type VI secretion system tip protein VgrG [Salmonella enterica]|nr:type VI secretion system tip protein VgrG [Salmonella enterica]